jgi:hypothetical protein
MVSLTDLANGPKVFEDTLGPKWGPRWWRSVFIIAVFAIVAACLMEIGTFGKAVVVNLREWILPIQESQPAKLPSSIEHVPPGSPTSPAITETPPPSGVATSPTVLKTPLSPVSPISQTAPKTPPAPVAPTNHTVAKTPSSAAAPASPTDPDELPVAKHYRDSYVPKP